MWNRLRGRIWRPVDKAVAVAVCLALVAVVSVVVVSLLPEDDECGEGLTAKNGQCIGVTERAHVFDEELESLIQGVADENAQVRDDWEDPDNGKADIPYVRIALMMPFTSDNTSAMTMDLIKHALAGAHAAQLRANEDSGLQYQLLLANDGKDLKQWPTVVEQLSGMTDDESPLVAVIGFPSSTNATQKAAEKLSSRSLRIPSVAPVLTSKKVHADYLFNTSASNGQLAGALAPYLQRDPGSGTGFLVWDSREQDVYASDLKKAFEDRYGEEYGLDDRNASYLGVIGEDQGIPQRFGTIAQKICLTEADTVFYAGRDRDLPGLITQLAEQASCDHDKPMRIMKVGIGMYPEFTDKETTSALKKARITLVSAADVDPAWHEDGNTDRPDGYQAFRKHFGTATESTRLGAKPLDDGYAVMYHDSFMVAVQAADESFTAANDEKNVGTGDGKGGKGEKDGKDGPEQRNDLRMPDKDDVYNTIINMNILGTQKGSDCLDCVRGASGTFGFDTDEASDNWPVCKPLPIVEYPARPEKEGEKPLPTVRTDEEAFGECP